MTIIEGRDRRNDSISLVLRAEPSTWKDAYRAGVWKWFEQLAHGAHFTGETLRMVAMKAGIGEPHHPNAWGGIANGVIRNWLRTKQITVVGLQSATDAKSHAHLYRVYEKQYCDDGLGD